MTTEEDLIALIASFGDQIKAAKAENKPKEEWDHILNDMLSAKAKLKKVTGKDFGLPSKSKEDSNKNAEHQQGPSEKNKEKNAKKAAAKAEKEAKKAQARAEREAREKAKKEKASGVGQDNFGTMPMVQSQKISDKFWTKVEQLKPVLAGQEVLVRGYLQTTRVVGKGVFVVIRSSLYTVQGVAFEKKDGNITNAMIKFIDALPDESIVDMKGVVTVPDYPVESVTQKAIEIQISSFHCVCKATEALPFRMEDACRPDFGKEIDVGAYNEDDEEEPAGDGQVRVGQKMRLDYRWLDLRTPANQSIFRIESMVGVLFRECLVGKGFIEIHSPKLIGGASEGGADVFTLDYFGRPACLAMSPQLHKQITAACSGFERVFTTGPVFRAENSNTRRYIVSLVWLCES